MRQKVLTAVIGLGLAYPAMAQTSLTLFGTVDVGLARGVGSVSDKTSVRTAGLSVSKFGFRGTEDLGGGLKAGFWMEAGYNADDGTGQGTNSNNQVSGSSGAFSFGRRSMVTLGGNWGEVRLGRDYTPAYWNWLYDALGNNGVGLTQTLSAVAAHPSAVRTSNGVGYFLPAGLGGFYGQVMAHVGENPSNAANADDGNGAGVRMGWGNGTYDIALATQRTDFAVGDARYTNVGGSWKTGAFKFFGHLTFNEYNNVKARGGHLGAHWYVGAGTVRVGVSNYREERAGNPETRKFALGYVHALSKRTAVYSTYTRVTNRGGASVVLNGAVTGANMPSTGVEAGIKHDF